MSSDGARVVAAFDFDGTLTRGSSLVAFLGHVRGLGTASALVAWMAPRLAWGALHDPSRDPVKEALVGRALAGLEVGEAQQLGRSFAEAFLPERLRPDVHRRVHWHRERGHHVVIVSASPALYIAPAGEILGVDAVLATELQVGDDGKLTGRFEGLNCRGPEKLARLRAWSGRTPIRLWAYGNSAGDADLLEAADVAVRVGRKLLPDLPLPAQPAAVRSPSGPAVPH